MHGESPSKLFGENEKLVKRKRDYFDGSSVDFGLLKAFSSTEPKKQRSVNFMPKLDLSYSMDDKPSHQFQCMSRCLLAAISSNWQAFDENKFLEWMPKHKRQKYLHTTKSESIFTKGVSRITLHCVLFLTS
jgi:hypothetical protein